MPVLPRQRDLHCVDDGIFASPDDSAIDKAIQDITRAEFDIEDQGSITDYLGVNVDKFPDGRIKLFQPHLTDQILKDVKLPRHHATATTPAASTKILRRELSAPAFNGRLNY